MIPYVKGEIQARTFENRILRRIFGHLNGENREWNSLSCSPNIVKVIKSLRLSWTGHVARMEQGRNALKIVAE